MADPMDPARTVERLEGGDTEADAEAEAEAEAGGAGGAPC